MSVSRGVAGGSNSRRLFCLGIAIATGLFITLAPLKWAKAQTSLLSWGVDDTLSAAEVSPFFLPAPQTHPLPPTLAQWQAPPDTGNYFSEIKLTPMGYLVWSEFPITIYVDQPTDPTASPSSLQRFQSWVEAVLEGVRAWGVYLPLEVVAQPEDADISILRSRPPLQASFNRETGKLERPRVRAAETHYEFYLRPGENTPEQLLSHRFTIHLSPDQTVEYTMATARHELGHALGIWGHSPVETDTMYFSQVRNPPQISARDINTLKQIYEQPTRLGWPLISDTRMKESSGFHMSGS